MSQTDRLAVLFYVCLYHFKLRLCYIDARVLITVGCWIMLMPVPWNEPWTAADEGL